MAVSKNSKTNRGITTVKDQVLIKWHKKARMWCRTEFKTGKQNVTFHSEKPSE